MDSIWIRRAGFRAAPRFSLAAIGNTGRLLFAAAALFAADVTRAVEALPRAQAITTAKQLAAGMDETLHVLPRIAYQIAGLRGRIE
ncbi:MAG: hypothetical protein IJI03_19665, partial [Rudaea sp.]|nr:hypothetical protein [Rudaea sp.]